QPSQCANFHGECVLGARLVLGAEAKRFAGIDVLQAKLAAVRYPKGFRETSGALDGVLRAHGIYSPLRKPCRMHLCWRLDGNSLSHRHIHRAISMATVATAAY